MCCRSVKIFQFGQPISSQAIKGHVLDKILLRHIAFYEPVSINFIILFKKKVSKWKRWGKNLIYHRYVLAFNSFIMVIKINKWCKFGKGVCIIRTLTSLWRCRLSYFFKTTFLMKIKICIKDAWFRSDRLQKSLGWCLRNVGINKLEHGSIGRTLCSPH